ncbi:helicase/relaxase domain-containing protein [Pseudorhodoferax sp. LjRoot39]|uniref:MobH family relaxase n=1 Tax=Pseudorhodoferax sp. LjRoot39 TaxID=3342328 RepID=UPI003ECEFBD2
MAADTMADHPADAAGRLRQLGQALFGRVRKQVASVLPRASTASPATPAAPAAALEPAAGPAPAELAGSTPGWLRVCDAGQLLDVVQADKALKEIYRKTRFSHATWERDCLVAIRRYAEFAQLLPASEAHHHAHAGGLLAHTLEMLLAALAWRSGRMLPEGAPIEQIDAQRDEWTLVVFYCALLHDIAKPMTDLRVSWRSKDMADPLRWHPTSGALTQVTQGRARVEYLVEFTPKALRDYRAHSKLAMLLLPHIAPASALAILARTPAAFECLNRYLSGEDKDSLVARIVREADKASTRRALQSGSRARFASASAVPLVDLLMQAVQDLLRQGTTLPLNRTGAAGWVFDGSIWFVAKRLADATRDWIKKTAPDEAVPGEAKNDRLFDTWQEYGCIVASPQSGQAIWYVTVHGAAPQQSDVGDRGGQGAYTHCLSVLRFPLDKVYSDPAHYPSPMLGHIEVNEKRGAASDAVDAEADATGDVPEDVAATRLPDAARPAGSSGAATDTLSNLERGGNAGADAQAAPTAAPDGGGKKHEAAPGARPAAAKDLVRSPTSQAFLKGKLPSRKNPQAASPADPTPADPPPARAATGAEPGAAPRRKVFEDLDDEYLLSPDESAQSVADQVQRHRTARAAAQLERAQMQSGAAPRIVSAPPARQTLAASHRAAPEASPPSPPSPPQAPRKPAFAGLMLTSLQLGAPPSASAAPSAAQQSRFPIADEPAGPAPVLLPTKLPPVPGAPAPSIAAPGPLAAAFMQWVQASLVDRSIKYNETGAVVHFVPLGMALVSPLIFKLYAQAQGPDGAPADEFAMQVQRDLIRANLHVAGPNRTNIVSFEVIGRGDTVVSRLSAVVLTEPGRWVQPVPPSNPVLRVK